MLIKHNVKTGCYVSPLDFTKLVLHLDTGNLKKIQMNKLPDTNVDTTRWSMYDQTCVMQLKPSARLPHLWNRPPLRDQKKTLLSNRRLSSKMQRNPVIQH